jgi:hypothetical protein
LPRGPFNLQGESIQALMMSAGQIHNSTTMHVCTKRTVPLNV